MYILLKNANLLLTFLLEMAVLVSLGYWGFQTGQGSVLKIMLGLGSIALAVAIWAMFGSPKARWHLQGFWRLLLQTIFFGSAALALFVTGHQVLSIFFALLIIVNIAMNHIYDGNT